MVLSAGLQTILSHLSVRRTPGTAHVVTVAPVKFFETHEKKSVTQVVVVDKS